MGNIEVYIKQGLPKVVNITVRNFFKFFKEVLLKKESLENPAVNIIS